MQRLNVVSRHIAGPASVPFDQNLVEVETADEGRIAIVSLNRPKALNALNNSIIRALNNALLDLSEDPKVACVILTGRGKAFAAGADITELNTKTVLSMRRNDSIAEWERVLPHMKIPVIAAVNGVAFGGGCEIAMMCDIILASEKAKFGQPEIKLGLIPGAGGTQRLTKAVGKSHAMLVSHPKFYGFLLYTK
uniref:Enoyl-CoA hydratase n=1 Tax=Chromera velia CCMP2878 TaxID=1169474 RepID=A0A0G4HAY7_9ALVE|eukprot:Cvel_6101.t1-p1 / transcript=Cvel_6101.t1 / gene=Cvel_6101 / organism=Chromera_velia_CCMP2878 / gene_product=Probable enoyl-CoA hydratase, mitochondrial, putative / transcript_product=Probable enoyl-CoA hydratase, mitochondrial, putative / location=Cvel_scaffold294:38558-42675(+) / protein_length=192 / sequence_SO=supercontig / SO=protein_coding / is_pseudo=false